MKNKNFFKTLSLIVVCVMTSVPKGNSQVPDASPDVMLQAFYWNSHDQTRWWDLTQQVDEISYYFDMVWLPPSASGEGGKWANMGYHPYQWSDQESSWGSKDELKTLISRLKAGGSRAIADIIINHRSGNGWVDFPLDNYGYPYVSYQLNSSHICKDDEAAAAGYPVGPNYDYNWNVSGDKWGGYAAARDLDHSQEFVRTAIKEYLWFMKNEIGYDGWRYDLVKGYAPWYTKEYNETLGNYFSVGEYYQNNYDDLKAWVDGTGRTSTVFDFCFKQAMYEWGGGSNYSKLAWYDPTTGKMRPAGLVHSPEMRKYAVTFIDNHDTATPHEGAWEYGGNVARANAIMLAAPGIPCVFWKHWVSNKAAIKAMIESRKKVGLHSESDVQVTNTNGYYESISYGKCGELICRVGSWSGQPAGYTLDCLGDGWAYYIKTYGSGCELGAPQLGTVTVRFKAPANWSAAHIWAYNEHNRSENYSGYVWPGTQMSLDKDGYYTVTLKNVTTSLLGAVINDGGNTRQTVDLMTSGDICWEASGSYTSDSRTYHYVDVNASCLAYSEDTNDPITIRVMPTDAFNPVYIYGWDGGSNGTETIYTNPWPGTQMGVTRQGYYSHTFPADVRMVHVVFTDGNATGTKQSDDVEEIRTTTCFELASDPHYNVYGQLIYGVNAVACPATTGAELRNTTDILSVSTGTEYAVYPNPVKDLLFIEGSGEIKQITIQTISGAVVKTGSTSPLSLSDLSSGIYLLKVTDGNGDVMVTKIMKQ